MAAITFRQVTRGDIEVDPKLLEDMTQMMTRAFINDNFTNVALGANKELIPPLKRAQILSGLDGGEVWIAESFHNDNREDKAVVAVAVWFGPGRAMFDTPEQKGDLLGPVFERIEGEVKSWWGEYFLPKYAELTNTTLGEGVKLGAWHLQTIGVLPEYKGRGILRKLIEVVKSKNELLCLEAINALNEKIYAHLGFQTKGEGSFVGKYGEFTFWVMVLPPGRSEA